MEYKVEIKEILKKTITVKAECWSEAEDIARKKYEEEEIVLDSEDYESTDFYSHLKPIEKNGNDKWS